MVDPIPADQDTQDDCGTCAAYIGTARIMQENLSPLAELSWRRAARATLFPMIGQAGRRYI